MPVNPLGDTSFAYRASQLHYVAGRGHQRRSSPMTPHGPRPVQHTDWISFQLAGSFTVGRNSDLFPKVRRAAGFQQQVWFSNFYVKTLRPMQDTQIHVCLRRQMFSKAQTIDWAKLSPVCKG